jgi:hypothetical protein
VDKIYLGFVVAFLLVVACSSVGSALFPVAAAAIAATIWLGRRFQHA